MPASLAVLASQTAAAPGAAGVLARAGLVAGSAGDASSAFAGLIDNAQTHDPAAPSAAPAGAPSISVASDAKNSIVADAPPPSTNVVATLPGASTLPSALLGFLTQTQAATGTGDATPASQDAGPPGAKAAADASATLAPATLSSSGAAPPKPAPKPSSTSARAASAAKTSTAALSLQASTTGSTSAPALATPDGDDDGSVAKADRDKTSASPQSDPAALTPLASGLVLPPPSPALLSTSTLSAVGAGIGRGDAVGTAAARSPATVSDAALDPAAETASVSEGTGAANGQPSAIGVSPTAVAQTNAVFETAQAAPASLEKAGDAKAAPPPAASLEAAGAAAASAPQAVAVASATAATPIPSTVVTPPPASNAGAAASTTSAPTDAAASAATAVQAGAAASASAASSSARFAAPKSTAATSFRGAPTSTRSTTLQTGAGTATGADTSEAAPSGQHSLFGIGAAHADNAIDANIGGATASPGSDTSSSPAGVAFPATAVLSPDAAGSVANAPADGPAAKSGAETAANLSAEIVQKLAGQNTRFDVQLNPNGLGRVDVAVQIDAKGALTASLSFEKPEAASLLRAHAGDLQQSLTQAGFDLSNTSLSFSTADQNGRGSPQSFFAGDFGGGQNANQGGQGSSAGRAFNAASLAAAQADTIAVQSQGLSARGVDIRI